MPFFFQSQINCFADINNHESRAAICLCMLVGALGIVVDDRWPYTYLYLACSSSLGTYICLSFHVTGKNFYFPIHRTIQEKKKPQTTKPGIIWLFAVSLEIVTFWGNIVKGGWAWCQNQILHFFLWLLGICLEFRHPEFSPGEASFLLLKWEATCLGLCIRCVHTTRIAK